MFEKNELNATYWAARYQSGQTPWDTGSITTPLLFYLNQLQNQALKILIPGGGYGHEAEYLHRKGFSYVYLLDFSEPALQQFARRVPDFPEEHLLQQDFFTLEADQFDLVLEQTFFCALPRFLRPHYARHMHTVLRPGGTLVGVLFSEEMPGTPGPPFGGTALEYQAYFEPYFRFKHFAPCYNSIKPRQGHELFMVLTRRERPQFIA